MQIDTLTVTYGPADAEKTEVFSVRAIKMRARAKMIDDHRAALKKDEAKATLLSAEFTLKFIADSVCDEQGGALYKPDDIDEWHPAKIAAYEKAIVQYQNPTLEAAAKNSLTTPSAAT